MVNCLIKITIKLTTQLPTIKLISQNNSYWNSQTFPATNRQEINDYPYIVNDYKINLTQKIQ